MNEKEIIQACIRNDRKAQQVLYEQYSPVLFGLIRRYISDEFVAEDLLVESFLKIFQHLKQFQGKGSFEGWMKRVAVNECLMYLRKRHVFHLTIESDNIVLPFHAQIEEKIDFDILLKGLDLLPTGYRTVFNLYVLEGMKHKDIARELKISVNTSKSQLRLAKERLRKIFQQNRISITG